MKSFMVQVGLLFCASIAMAAWQTVDDFESYGVNTTVVGQNGWANSTAANNRSFFSKAVANPDGAGQVLEYRKTGGLGGYATMVQTGSGFIAKTLVSPQTVFLRFRFADNTGLTGAALEHVAFGVAANTNIGDYSTIKQGFVINDSDNDNTADTLMTPNKTDATNLLADVWYNAWLVTDNQTPDSAKLYLQSAGDARFSAQTEIISGQVDGWIRAGGASPYKVFALTANHPSGPTFYVDDLYYDNDGENLFDPGATVSGYEFWAAGWGGIDIGSETNNYDGDVLNNLYEYGLGGDPTNPADIGFEPALENNGGMLTYVHAQRTDDPALAYSLELTDDLVSGIWTNAGYSVSGTNVTGGTFNFATNAISPVVDRSFIRLLIEN